jgi:hypothetical protein
MSRWEHRTIVVEYGNGCTERLHVAMHELEVVGWELISAVNLIDAWRLFFKRQVLDESEDK